MKLKVFIITIILSIYVNAEEQNSDLLALTRDTFTKEMAKKFNNNCSMTGATGATGPRGAKGNTGATGSAGTFSSSYGQLIVSAQEIFLDTANDWVAIPFNLTGSTSNMNVSTTSPATITVQASGIYQINSSLYFSAEDSDEGPFTQTTYSLGVRINGGSIVACAAVYAGESGDFSLNYSSIMELSANDTIQFYMQSSNGDAPFSDNVTLENGNVYLMQIAS